MTYTSSALETQGFKLEINNGGSPNGYTEVKEIVSFQGFDGEASEIDVTHLQSSAKEFRMGLQDFGNFAVDTNYLPDDPGQEYMRNAKASRIIQTFRATFSDASTAIFTAFVKSAPVSGGVDAKLDGSFSLRISGSVTFS